MSQAISKSEERALYLWLTAQPKVWGVRLSPLLQLSVVLFASQLALMWFIASACYQLIIEAQHPDAALLLPLALLFALQAGLTLLKQRKAAQLEQQITERLRQAIQAKLVERNLALVRAKSHAFWQACLMERAPIISRFYVDYVIQQRLSSIAPVLVMGLIGSFNWLLLLVLLVATPLIPLFMWLTGMGAATAHRQHFDAIDKLSHRFLDRLRGRRLIQLFQRQRAEIAALSDAGQQLNQRTMKVLRLAFLSSSVLDFFATVAMALVAVLVGFSLLGEINVGQWRGAMRFDVGLYILLITPLFFSELKRLGRFYHIKSEAVGAASVIRPLLEVEPIAAAHQAPPLTIPPATLIAADGVELLKTPTLSLAAAEHIWLCGPSGTGKTLLLEALLGQQRWIGEQGAVTVLEPTQVFWLGQGAVISPYSIRANLTLGHPFPDARLLEVLAAVELSTWLAQFAAGLDHPLGEHPPLSGGEAQRLALARALLFDKPVVFLDEPTAHLCIEQHQRIATLLQRLLRDKTLVWVSHRPLEQSWFSQRWQLDDNGQLSVSRREGNDVH